MSEPSLDEISYLLEIAGRSYSPIAKDALRRVTSQMIEEPDIKISEMVYEQIPNNDNEPSIEGEQSTSSPVVPGGTKQSRRNFRYIQKLAPKGKLPNQDRLKG